MRTAQQLIDEFTEIAKGAFYATIIVAFKEETKFVEHNEPDQVAKLNALMRQDGQPIGFFCVSKTGKKIDCFIQVFREFAGQAGIEEYVHAIGNALVAQMAAAVEADNQQERAE